MSKTADDYINSAYGEIEEMRALGNDLDGYRFVMSYDAYRAISNSRDFMLSHGFRFNASDPDATFLGLPFVLDPSADGVALKKTLDT